MLVKLFIDTSKPKKKHHKRSWHFRHASRAAKALANFAEIVIAFTLISAIFGASVGAGKVALLEMNGQGARHQACVTQVQEKCVQYGYVVDPLTKRLWQSAGEWSAIFAFVLGMPIGISLFFFMSWQERIEREERQFEELKKLEKLVGPAKRKAT